MYVIEGPCGLGNVFGFYREDMLPAGMYAVVENGEYTNGGNGPSTVDGIVYPDRDLAEKAMEYIAETA